MNKKENPDNHSNFLLYTGSNSKVHIEVFLKDETVWLTQKAIGMFFGKSKATISEHLLNIFKTDELDENSVVRNSRTTARDGKTYSTNFYNLEDIMGRTSKPIY